jgi:dienelactone hydrolase
MADLILFHHVQGLTDGVKAFGDQIRADGHRVTIPDFYDGETFTTIEEGIAHVEDLGFGKIVDAGVAVAEQLPSQVFYAGFSLGAFIAQKLAQTRRGALGALLYHHGDVAIDTFGQSWPDGVDLQIHVNQSDEFFEPDVVDEFIEQANTHARAELFLYPGSTHLFTDSSLDDFNSESAALALQRTLDLLRRHR